MFPNEISERVLLYWNWDKVVTIVTILREGFDFHATVHRDKLLVIEPTISWSCSQAVNIPVWHVPLLCVQWKTPDDGQRNCPKHVDFHYKIKFWYIIASSWFYYKQPTGRIVWGFNAGSNIRFSHSSKNQERLCVIPRSYSIGREAIF
jgi:hypothetical protein